MSTTSRPRRPTAQKKRSDRLSVVVASEFQPDSLIGSFFHSDAARGWQGCVVAEPSPGVYLVETFEWWAGGSYDQHLMRLEEMAGWVFYDTAEWMTNAYQDAVQRRWADEREKAGGAAKGDAEEPA